MFGKIYTVLFILTILSSLWYQRYYLKESAVEFNAQVMAENSVLPTMTGKNYNSLTFQDGIFSSSFSGKNMTYFSDKHFEATENLVYTQINSSPNNNPQDNLSNGDTLLKTDRAVGEVISTRSGAVQTLMSKNTLKYVRMPDIVDFSVGKNTGQTSNVYYDALARTMETENPISAHGPSGNIRGIGFFYAIKRGDFVIKSNVDGMILPTQVPKN